MTGLVWGADVGGTSTRVAVAGLDGTVRQIVTAGPGNPHAVGIERSLQRIRAAAEHALALVGPDEPVLAAAVGLAGVTAVDPTEFGHQVSSRVRVRVVADLAAAYASGTPARHGIVALAGTGAGAMELWDGEAIRRRNAWGWLLGDEGSGQWIGREAVRHTLAVLEARASDSAVALDELAVAVLELLRLPPTTATDLPTLSRAVNEVIRASYLRGPTTLAELAPLVSRTDQCIASGRILDEAAGHVSRCAMELAAGEPELPIVLAGALLGPRGPLRERVRDRLSTLPNPVAEVTDGVAGACWIALSGLDPSSPAANRQTVDAAVHERLVETAGTAPRHDLTG